jgi:hypothetical protein
VPVALTLALDEVGEPVVFTAVAGVACGAALLEDVEDDVVAGRVLDTLVLMEVTLVLVLVLTVAADPPMVGAATAFEESTSAPVPHGMGALVPGWVGLVGGVLWPEASAMVKRVVHVMFGLAGLVNW